MSVLNIAIWDQFLIILVMQMPAVTVTHYHPNTETYIAAKSVHKIITNFRSQSWNRFQTVKLYNDQVRRWLWTVHASKAIVESIERAVRYSSFIYQQVGVYMSISKEYI